MNDVEEVAGATDQAELVCEYVDSDGMQIGVGRQRGVLQGVKLLGLRSRNGRRYAESALRSAIGLYEGAKVNVNHPDHGPLAARDYRDRLGVIRNVRLQAGAGLFGDLHYNPKHALAEQLEWDAAHAPRNVGLSHNVLAKTTRDGAGVCVEAITQVQSVDLVADPATTDGLFEEVGNGSEVSPVSEPGRRQSSVLEVDDRAEDRTDRSRKAREHSEREASIERLLTEQGLREIRDDPAVTDVFLAMLQAAPEEDLPLLIEDRKRLVERVRESSRPEAIERDPLRAATSESTTTTDAFVRSISNAR